MSQLRPIPRAVQILVERLRPLPDYPMTQLVSDEWAMVAQAAAAMDAHDNEQIKRQERDREVERAMRMFQEGQA